MKKIVVVDDNVLIIKMLSDRLLKEGYEVSVARNGQEGLEIIAQEQPDLVVLDIVMPVMDGLTMLKTLRQQPAGVNLPVIILSSMEDSKYVASALEGKVYFYMVKNQSDVDLVTGTINDILNGKQA
jgi:CheY-like chemotaxis protein